MKQNYCVYMLLDPCNDNTPFYVGKGLISRPKQHLEKSYAERDKNKHKQNRIAKIRSFGFEPVIFIVEENLSNQDACEKEIALIFKYGRADRGGILSNLTDGGDYGWKPQSRKERKKMNGKDNPNFGKTWEQIYGLEGAQKLREKRKIDNRTPKSLESNRKRSEKLRNRVRDKSIYTEEWKKQHSLKKTGISNKRLTKNQIIGVLETTGLTNSETAKIFGISVQMVSGIKNGRFHSSITGIIR
jgi:hypothetical protein